MPKLWRDILLPSTDDQVWQLFHENSKNAPLQESPSQEDVARGIQSLHECLDFEGYPIVTLQSLACKPIAMTLERAIMDRRSAQTLKPSELSLQDVATLLHYAYGVNRQYVNKALQRSLRHVPSAGALYPLEIFFQSNRVKSLEPGLYHYHPIRHHMRLLQPALSPTRISEALIQPDIASGASLIIFITGLFERSIFKYGDRGYRYCLIEAGHVAQNLDLVSTALGLGFMNVGGFFDRRVDEFLGLDGVTHSVLYLVAIGEHSAR